MNITKTIFPFFALFLTSYAVMAKSCSQIETSPKFIHGLKESREWTVKRYLNDLQKGFHEDIVEIFEPNGIVISTSRGKINAKEFFYAFLPNIVFAKTEQHQFFINEEDPNRVAVRFHFSYKLKNGEQGDGEYVDEFIFPDNSTKLSAVYMFENLKFPKE